MRFRRAAISCTSLLAGVGLLICQAQAQTVPKNRTPASAEPVAPPAPAEPTSMVRFACEGASLNAEVSINGAFVGECPVDVTVKAGLLSIRAIKPIDSQREQAFEQQLRMAGGTVKRVTVELGPPQLTPEAQRIEDARLAAERKAQEEARLAEEARVAAEKRAADEALRVKQQAAYEMRQRADAGDVPSMVQLADAYRAGHGVPTSREQAFVWDLRAAQGGDAPSMVRVAESYEDGKGVGISYPEARNWFQKAVNTGSPAGMGGLAASYYNDRPGMVRDIEKAKSWAERGAAAGDGRSLNVKALMALTAAPSDPAAQQAAVVLWLEGAARGDRKSMATLGWCYVGRFQCGLEENWVEGLRLFRAAYAKGEDRVMSWIGSAYRSGHGGVGKDTEEAMRWFRRGVEVNDTESMRELAAVLYHGNIGQAANPAEAVRLWRLLAERGNDDTMNDLGLAYWQGKGVPKSAPQAQLWWRKAAALGHAQAQRNLKLAGLD